MKILKIFFLFILVLSGRTSYAFDPDTIQMSQSFRWKIRFKADASAGEVAANQIIKEIAYDEVLGLNRAYINADLYLNCKIFPSGEEHSGLIVNVDSIAVSGNTHIRGFDLSEDLAPGLISLSISQLRKNDSLVIHKEQWKDLILRNGKLYSTLLRRYDPLTDTLIIKPEILSYPDSAPDHLRNRISLVNDYYACSSVLDSLKGIISNEKTSECHDIPVSFIRVEETWKAVELIGRRDFEKNLSLNKYDPLGFRLKYREVFRISRTLAMTFRDKLDTVTFIQRPSEACDPAVLFVDHLYRYIRWSQLVNSRNGFIYDDYLNNFFSLDVYDDDVMMIRKILYKSDQSNPPHIVFSNWASSVCDAFEKKALILMDEYSFAAAARLLDLEEQFIRKNGNIPENRDFSALRKKAINGIYDSFLGIAESSMKFGKYSMAENYLARAQEFRFRRHDFITGDSLFRIVAGNLISLKLTECDKLSGQEMFDSAIICYKSMNLVYDSLTTNIFKKEISRKTDYCYFRKYKAAGLGYLEANNPTEAGKYFHLACDLRIKNGFDADTLLDSLCNATFPFYLVTLLRSREELIWTDQIKLAKMVADSVEDAGKNYPPHPELTSSLEKFRQKIHDKECFNANDAYDIYQLRGQRNYELKNYVRGEMLTDSALLISRLHPDCHLDSMMLLSKISKYADAASFQKRQRNLLNLVSVNEYERAVSEYAELELFYNQKNLQSFGLNITDLFSFVSSKDIPALTYQALIHHSGNSAWNESLKYLKLLNIQGFPEKNTAAVQKEIAKGLAEMDYSPVTGPGESLKKYYTIGDWFSSFRYAYIYRWNQLKHEKNPEK